MTDKRNEEIMEDIQTKMLDAAKNGRYSTIVEILPIPIAEELKNMGYKIKDETMGSRTIISWRE